MTFERSTNIAQPLRDRLGEVAGQQQREAVAVAGSRQSTKLASIRPLGELKLAVSAAPGASAVDVAGQLALQERRGVGPATAQHRSGARSQTTAASRAAASRAASAVEVRSVGSGARSAMEASSDVGKRRWRGRRRRVVVDSGGIPC